MALDASGRDDSAHGGRWKRERVEARIAAMAPADALLAITLYNGRHFHDPSRHLDPAIALRGLADAEADEVRRKVAELHGSATSWGRRYWEKRLHEARQGITQHGDDAEIMAEMAARHPGFSTESLTDVYDVGFMLAR